ncbi:hypothetical protein C8R46DRAFT_1238058 [Mycena filopes]|nr:hypothetical protein C8R46DRAFT_1238058 [Mycena filopes]
MTNFIQLTPVPDSQQFSSSQTSGVTSLTGPVNTQFTIDQPVLDNALPTRSTCPMPYYPEPGVDRDIHSGAAGRKFYVCIPAHVQGTFTEEQRSLRNVQGWRHGKTQSVHTYDEAKAKWALCCLCRHGPVCRDARARPPVTMNTRIFLNPALREEKWALKGVSQLFASRQHAFAAAEALNLKKILVFGSYNEVLLEAWQYDDEAESGGTPLCVAVRRQTSPVDGYDGDIAQSRAGAQAPCTGCRERAPRAIRLQIAYERLGLATAALARAYEDKNIAS